MSLQNDQIYPKFKIPKEINRTIKEPIYINNKGKKIGQIIFRMDGSIGLYVKKDFIDIISRSYLRDKLGDNYTLGVLGRENQNRRKPSKF